MFFIVIPPPPYQARRIPAHLEARLSRAGAPSWGILPSWGKNPRGNALRTSIARGMGQSLRRSPSASPSHDEHGAIGAAHDVLGHRAEDGARDPGAAARAGDDQIGRGLARGGEDGVG